MYTKDKHNRITLRLNDDQFQFVKMNAAQLDVSPSDFLRMVVNSAMFSYQAMQSKLINQSEEAKKISYDAAEYAVNEYKKDQEGNGRENDKANQHDLV